MRLHAPFRLVLVAAITAAWSFVGGCSVASEDAVDAEVTAETADAEVTAETADSGVGSDVTTDGGSGDDFTDAPKPVEPLVCSEELPAPPVEETVGAVRVSDGPGRNHAAACGWLVWATPAGGLMAADLSKTGTPIRLREDGADARWPHVHDSTLVYVAGDPPQVIVRELSTHEEDLVAPSDAPQKRPRISSDLIVWEDERDGVAQVWARPRDAGAPAAVDPSDADQRFPASAGSDVLWTDFRDHDKTGVWEGDGLDDTEIYGRIDGVTTPLVQAPWKQAFAEIDSQGRVVWLDWRNAPHDEDGYPRPEPKGLYFWMFGGTLDGGAIVDVKPLAGVHNANYSGWPSLRDGVVAWAAGSQSKREVYTLSLATGNIARVPSEASADHPLLSLDRVIFRADGALQIVPLPDL